jgi:hypothetical protein
MVQAPAAASHVATRGSIRNWWHVTSCHTNPEDVAAQNTPGTGVTKWNPSQFRILSSTNACALLVCSFFFCVVYATTGDRVKLDH